MGFDPTVYEEPKVKKVLGMLSQGVSKDDIAKHFRNKNWKTIYIYFNRKGFRWDGDAYTFVPKAERNKIISKGDPSQFRNTRTGKIIRQLNEKKANIRYIMLRNGFTTVNEMGDYMKGQGYLWNGEIGNYEYDESVAHAVNASEQGNSGSVLQGRLGEYEELLKFLMSNENELRELLKSGNDKTLPRYKFRGSTVNKALGIPSSLQALLCEFSEEFNVTQRCIMEIALAEFFKKYGYAKQLVQALQRLSTDV